MNSSRPKTPVWFFVILVGVVLYSGYILINQQLMLDSIAADTEDAQAKLEIVQAENDALIKEKENLNNPEYIEKIARDELGMTRQGEMPYIYTKKAE